MSVTPQHDLKGLQQRIDFSGLFRSTSRSDLNSATATTTRRRRAREVSPLQFEPELDAMDAREETSMEALHFFGLSDVPSSTPVTPKMFDSCFDDAPNSKKRQRHFSLEDYNAMDESEDSMSSSTNLSTSNNLVCSKRVRHNSIFFPADDSAVSFGSSDVSFARSSSRRSSELFSASDLFVDEPSSMSLELDNDHIAGQLRTELEVRLLETLCPAPGSGSRRKFIFELPPQLLSIIASHVIQEAANEPYGLKGCLLHIYYESDTDCEYVASLDCDPDTLSTFELTLTLRQDAGKKSWRNKLPELVRSLSSFGFGSVLIGTSYKLVKRRNYRSPQDDQPEPTLRL